MDTAEIIVIIAGVLLIAFVLWFFFSPLLPSTAKNKSTQATARTGGEIIYACPMHPWVTSTDPTANCHICGMKLVQQSP